MRSGERARGRRTAAFGIAVAAILMGGFAPSAGSATGHFSGGAPTAASPLAGPPARFVLLEKFGYPL